MTLTTGHRLIIWSPEAILDSVLPQQWMASQLTQDRDCLMWLSVPDLFDKKITPLTQFQVNCSTPLWTRWPVWGRVRWWGLSWAAWRASSPSSSPPSSRSSSSKPWPSSLFLATIQPLLPLHITLPSLHTIHTLTQSNTNMWTITTISTVTRPTRFIIRFVNGDLLRKVVR